MSQVITIAKELGWKRLKTSDEYMVSFKKELEGGTARINVWSNRRNDLYTVGTYLNHPKQGRTQLFRKWVDDKELKQLFANPRTHTGKGYR